MMRKGLFLVLILSLLVLEYPKPAQANVWVQKTNRTVQSTVDGLVITWSSPQPQSIHLSDGSFAVQMDGFPMEQTPGMPQLPVDTLLITVPADAKPTLDIQIERTARYPISEKIGLVSGVITVPGEKDRPFVDPTQSTEVDPQPVVLQEVGVARGVRLARLVFRPVRVADGMMEVIQNVKVSVQFGVPVSSGAYDTASSSSQDPFLNALSGEIANPGQLTAASPAPQMTASLGIIDRTGQSVIEVSTTGLTAVTYADLANAGFPVGTTNPHTLHLKRANVEIPIEWDGDSDLVFEPGERLLFFAQPRFSRWTADDVYFLSNTSSPSMLISTRTADGIVKPAGTVWMDQIFEQNTIYTPDCNCAPIPAGRDGDRWVWDVLRQPDRASADYTFDLGAVDNTYPAQLTIWLIGYTNISANPDHRVQVKLNDTVLSTVEFEGKQAFQVNLTVPLGVLHSQDNVLSLSLPGVGSLVEGAWLDAFSLHYARNQSIVNGTQIFGGDAAARYYHLAVVDKAGLRAYDVTNPDAPVRLQDLSNDIGQVTLSDPASGLPRRYAVIPASAVQGPVFVRMVQPLTHTAGADMIIISPQEFISDLAGLVSLRESQGLRVVVEDVRAIYDAYDGRPTPEAVRAFLTYAYAAWKPVPLYVLLVGDGTTDPRHYRSDSTATWIPPFLTVADPVIGEIAADNQYVSVDGSDNLPDMWIGRLPVNSHVEAAITITKIVEYDRNPASGTWSRDMLMVGDQIDPTAGDFPDEIMVLTAAYQNNHYRLNPYVFNASTTQSEIHQNIIDSWNQGNGLVLYAGHGSIHQWGAEVIFHLNDLPLLSNGTRLPVLLEMTCLTGSFQIPNLPTLDETLLRRSGRGAVATWGSTGMGLSSGHMMLAHGFLDQVMADPKSSLGKATFQGKLNLMNTAPVLGYLVDTFTLLGDPAMRLNYRYESYLPAVNR